jgi:molybdopterin biosynthesis enzyme MoaB
MNRKHIQVIPVHAAIITVSSTRTKENDISGKTICDILTSAKIQIEH